MIGIGGGTIARDELEAGRKDGKTVRFYMEDMDYARVQMNATRAGRPVPQEFGGEAQSLFQD